MVRFDINGAIVEFDKKKDNYNSIRRLFKGYAEDSSTKYDCKCIENVVSIKQLLENSTHIVDNLVDDVIKRSIECIVSYGVIDVDFYTFKEVYCKKYTQWQSLLSNLNKEFTSQSRNKKNRANNELQPIVEKIKKYLYDDCFNIHLAVVDVLIDNKVSDVSKYIHEEDIKRANALFNNYKDGFISKPDECRVVKQIITLNPYRQDIYEFIIREDGDFHRDVDNLTEYLGYDIKPYKSTLADVYIKGLLEDRGNDIELAKEKLTKYCKYIGYIDDKVYLDKIDSHFSLKSAY